jgi:polyisoprenoid-binding protein YceI
MKEVVMRPMAALGLIAVAALLSGCPSTAVRPPTQTHEALPSIGAPDVRGATLYSIDSNATDVQIHVFRGGKLARLGHNHVMTSKHVSGRVWMHSSIERSGFELSLPVTSLIVDDAQARASAGNDFPGEISAADREGTQKNMLRTEVLDAEHHPAILLQSVRIEGSQQTAQVITRITIKAVAREVTVPTSIAIADGQLTATGEFDIAQTDFGIKPFSIGLGALEVLDRLHIEFKIVAAQQ